MDENSTLDFNPIAFEKKLTNLKDSQESINACCHWCLQNRQHHKKIVCCWLNVLKRVKVEQRLILFYLANDVIQYSKRRNYAFVESWGTSLQKATTMVRDEKVKHKILRIFKIWEQRDIYSEDFVTDLCGLISASPTVRKGDETHEFQSTYLVQKIRTLICLENDTDTKLHHLKEHHPKFQIESESLISSLKDRAHVDDVEKEIEDFSKDMESYIGALNSEIKERIHIITLLVQAQNQLALDKRDVNVVVSAYKTFAGRVKELKNALEKKMETLLSPVPSPDVNAPSPSPDSDDDETSNSVPFSPKNNVTNASINPASLYTNAGYYTPVPPPTADANPGFPTNNFSSFMGTSMSLDLQKLTTSSIFGNDSTQSNNASSVFSQLACPPPPPDSGSISTSATTEQYQFTPNSSGHVPLMPPPMPPFNKTGDNYSNYSTDSYDGPNSSTGYGTTVSVPPSAYESYQNPIVATPNSHQQTYQPPPSVTQFNSYAPPLQMAPPTVPPSYPISSPVITNNPPGLSYSTNEEYNPEEEVETWEPEPSWENPPPIEMETPESPPGFEKHSYTDPVEYHDSGNVYESRTDIDQRILTTVNDSKMSHRNKDVDHRNLISLTGSPNELKQPWSSGGDQDYRKPPIKSSSSSNAAAVADNGSGGGNNKSVDQDYRMSSSFNLDNFKLPPPPPPPNNMLLNNNNNSVTSIENMMIKSRVGISPRKSLDNNESIDMDLSDDEQVKESSGEQSGDYFELPPPFPNLSDDANANEFLDHVNQELETGDFNPSELSTSSSSQTIMMMPPPTPLMHPNNNAKPGLLGHAPGGIFSSSNNFVQGSPMFIKQQQQQHQGGGPPSDWIMGGPQQQDFNNHQPHQDFNSSNNNREFPFRGRGNTRGRFNNRGMNPRQRGGNVRGGGIRGNRGGGLAMRGGHMRGMMSDIRGVGNWGMNRGFRGSRGDFRGGRGSFRGNFRGGGNF